MGNSRFLTDEERAELAGLNDAVSAAIAARRKWLDDKMVEVSDIKVGDAIVDQCGRPLGVVTSLYRFWRDRDDGVRDVNLSIEYQFKTPRGWLDNTSRQPLLIVRKAP